MDTALARLPADCRALDRGTGSGAVALALAHSRPDADIWALDASPEALPQAQANGQRLNLAVTWRLSDWYAAVTGEQFDLLVSNPPYIAADDPHLQQGDLRFEPAPALASGADGLDAIREIISGAPGHLVPGGWLLLEHGWDQAAAVRELLHAQGLVQVQSRRDLGSHERCCGAQKAARAQGSQAGPPCA